MNTIDELLESNDLLRGATNNILCPILVTDPNYRILLANEAAQKIFGEKDRVVGDLCCYQFLHHHPKPCTQMYTGCLCPHDYVFSTKRPSISKQFFCDLQTRVLFMEVEACPILGEAGDVVQIVMSFHRAIPPKWEHEEIERIILDIQETLVRVKRLSGPLTLCKSCKRIHDEKGGWKILEKYILEHFTVHFTHDLCPDCVKSLYPAPNKNN